MWRFIISCWCVWKFRNNRLKNEGLCPSHYLSAPGLSWDAMLQMTKNELERIPDPDIFLAKGTRGWISYISDRYSKANNKYLKSYDPKEESKHITYLDANNFHGYSMSKFVATSRFKWIDPKESDFNKCASNSSKVCLEYPKELRELHIVHLKGEIEIRWNRNQKRNVVWLSTKDCYLYNIPIGNVKKLLPNSLWKLVTHYENLKLKTRIKTNKNTSRIKIQSITLVKTIYWIQHTKKNRSRQKIETKMKINELMYKLINNAVYCKAMENVRNRIDVNLVNNKKGYLECTSKPR